MTTKPESKSKGMCIATRCTSVDQFIQMFHRFVDEESFFVSTINTRPAGLETSFSVQLADGTPVLRGMCTVLESWPTSTSPFKTPGVRLGIKRLTANSMSVFEQLLVTRNAQKSAATPPPTPAPRMAAGTVEPGFLDAPTNLSTAKVAKPPDDDDEPIIETRTPGSDLVLPANPLMNLTDESLEGYVDCTLYEETGNFFPIDEDGTPLDDTIEPPVLDPRPALARAPTPLPIAEAIPPTPKPASLPSTPPPTPTVATSAEPTTQAAGEPRVDLAPRQRRRPRYWIAGGFAVIAVATVLFILNSMQGDSSAAPKPARNVVAQRDSSAPPATDKPADPVEEVDEIPPPGEGPQLVGDGPCKLAVETTPAGSMIQLDDQTVAPSPVTIATTCGKHKVDVSHARYQTATKLVTVEEGTPGTVDVRLTRPTHIVTVTSVPSGATILIDGRPAGSTPSKLAVMGFSTMNIELKKTGFQPTTAKLYSRVAQDKLNVRLTKW